MLLKRWRWSGCADSSVILPVFLLCLWSLAGCTSIGIGTETAFVVSERMELRSSTAKVFKPVGELKNGDRVTILEHAEEEGRSWAKLRGPNGQAGWADARFLVSGDVVSTLQRMADETKAVPAQAVGQAKSYLKLRTSPDRAADDNVVTRLQAGTSFEIIDRERKPRPASLEPKSTVSADDEDDEKDSGQKYDEWFRVRLKDNKVLPAGWVYGGSVQLDIPDEIAYYASMGHKIIGWQKIGTVSDSGGRSGGAYLVLEKEIYPEDKDKSGKEDFDRIQVISWDPGRRDYFTPVREDVRGKFPVTLKMDGNHGKIQLKELDKSENLQPRDCTVELTSDGKVTVTGLKSLDPRGKRKK